MSKKECIAMLLAGGQGSRLGALTSNVAKPAVSFGGKFRIIDFALSNCANSGVTTVGVLTQYRPYLLHNYIGTGGAWNLDDREGGVSILPPYATQTGGAWYEGTADAVTQNLGYIEQNDPEYVLILSGDQLYRMDYADMLATHKRNNADLTIAVMPVPWEEASRFGIITADGTGRITKFTEKPKQPDSNLAFISSARTCWSAPSRRTPPTRPPSTTLARTSSLSSWARASASSPTSSTASGVTSAPSPATTRRAWTSLAPTRTSTSTARTSRS